MVTVAPGITAPVGSATVPVTAVEFPAFWAIAIGPAASKHTAANRIPSNALTNLMISPCMSAAPAHPWAAAKNECENPHAPRDMRRVGGGDYLVGENALKPEGA